MTRPVTIATLTMGYHTNCIYQDSYRQPTGLPFGGTLENNLALLEATILEAGRALRAQFVCLSEVALSLGLKDAEARRAVVRVPGPEVERLARAAQQAGCYVVVGLLEKAEPVGYNSAVLLGPEGEIVGVYRKVHITPTEYVNDVYPLYRSCVLPLCSL